MCRRCERSEPATLAQGIPAVPTATGTCRRKLWQIPKEYLCSIVGTCLGPDDLDWLQRRLSLQRDDDARDYDVHRYFVQQAGIEDRPARQMQKRLDEKYSGELRRFAAAGTEAEWAALWDAAVAAGKVAPAYWAVLSHGGIGDALKVRAFGEVHMLSHLMGGENRQRLRETEALRRRVTELEERLARADRAAADRLAEKEGRIRALEAETARLRAAAAAPVAVSTVQPGSSVAKERAADLDNLRRRLTVERLRARQAEAECKRLGAILDGRQENTGLPAHCPLRRRAPDDATAVQDGAERDLAGRAILYVGGRTKMMPHLRAAVEQRNGSLMHHDGGLEMTVRGLEGLVERADVVICPIDCVSHDACLRVKGLCRRHRKPFVPIRSAGASNFARVLQTLTVPAAAEGGPANA